MEYLADTVTIVRHMRGRRLGPRAAHILDQADLGQHTIDISAITLMEVLYLSQRRRIELRLRELLTRVAASPNYAIIPIGPEIVGFAEDVDDVPELHDRILVATAGWLQVPILTSDRVIAQSSHAEAIW